ncbi:MAG: hypothetical protein JNK23_10420 [Opitutaceae bacterium]|nr:hypothetical protein [Opitutaceae bacterium]
MNELRLNLHDDGDLVLPVELLKADLCAGELVSLVGFFAFQEGHYDFANKLFLLDESGTAARGLRDRGILQVVQDGNKVTITVDLRKLP